MSQYRVGTANPLTANYSSSYSSNYSSDYFSNYFSECGWCFPVNCAVAPGFLPRSPCAVPYGGYRPNCSPRGPCRQDTSPVPGVGLFSYVVVQCMGIVDNTNNTVKEKWERRRTIKQPLKALGTCKILSLYSCVQFQVLKCRNAGVITTWISQRENFQQDMVCSVELNLISPRRISGWVI